MANLTVETTVRSISSLMRDGVLKSSHFSALSADERHALADMLEPYEPSELPYG
jgi:hypothetical protein